VEQKASPEVHGRRARCITGYSRWLAPGHWCAWTCKEASECTCEFCVNCGALRSMWWIMHTMCRARNRRGPCEHEA